MLAIRTYIHVYIRRSCIKPLFLTLYSTSTTQSLAKPIITSSKFQVYCNSQISKNGRNGNIIEAEAIFNRMPNKNIISWTAMLTAYAENGQIKKARNVFNEMPERSVASWNAMITAYIRNIPGIDGASELFQRMPDRNAVSYAAMITGFVQAGMLNRAEELYAETPVIWREPVCSNALISGYLKKGKLEKAVQVFDNMVQKDVVSWSSMVDGYCKAGRIGEAKELFDRMPERNVVSWTAMINGYLKIGCFEDGFGLFLQMRREGIVRINSTTLTIIFEACGNLGRYREGIQMHGMILPVGFNFDVFLGNSMMNMYSRFDCIDAAIRIFHMMSRKDVVSWNSIIAGYVQAGEIEEAYELFNKMPEKDVVSWTTMITGFSNKGWTGKSVELFKSMTEKDDIAWTAVISGFVNNEEYEEAIRWFIQMLQTAIRPNPLTLSSVLSASASMATLNQGLQLHAHVVKMDTEFDLSIQNSLIAMYSKCGNVDDAYKVFINVSAPNVISFNSMITGFAQNGLGKEALKLFNEMQNKGQEPNQITFLGVLSACTHVGLVDEGWHYFKSMKSSYETEPGPDHYACMVDLLGRAGLLDEAINLIKSMPIKPHSGVWGALLGASSTHLRLDLAKLAAERLFELEPNNATAYVVLSNIYSVAGKRKDEERVRVTKKSKGIRKAPGCSWIMVKDQVNLFLAGDESHINFEEIKSTLWIIMDEMRQMRCHQK
ncbi:pentatricopeptide repeat-containing protein At1g53600, mitochondrial-like [Cornus florida]|uniref:pentatricopeptide repeat-containing protein At1g53600, mitochondrial-like n=1 Tax=Cornus florida TaxID=4283 RepID=UPI00289D686F|nr:pentatricopeptide repeat-containing protein At1g53600, mitochondrial-like [Cornus florida]XP_059661370.1 pentatricopeptide repeat-containing protein At1g53600, mitochondrial-like [Cornus florida]XP_059661371.1 pentatricopeptide repeat-containing protein At1g53600, mitochondrial-like [Cornus florida]